MSLEQKAKQPRSLATRQRILRATVDEIVESGFDGVRLERVAARAGCNKALLYRYFGDRKNLFVEAFRAQLQKRLQVLNSLPNDLGQALAVWTQQTVADPIFMKLILRESIDYQLAEPEVVEQQAREAYYQTQIEMLKQLQQQGVIASDIEPKTLFLALLAMISLPAALPQVVYLVTGQQADKTEFLASYTKTLTQIAEGLRS